ncbi:MAG: LytTR family transcriptional regulator, partial [Litoreibacter sp.]|nr:LytTR family transcriptional regulator [Litoreibacter sp.]
MFTLGSLGFATPLLLVTLILLPVLWWLLRAVPPAPIRRRFPGVALLLGLKDDESQTDKTPWWLLLLRMLAIAAFIIGFAGPVLNPDARERGTGPLLVVMDASWASARDWPSRVTRVESLLREAGRDGRAVAVVPMTDLPAGELTFQTADTALRNLPGLSPQAWAADAESASGWIAEIGDASFETVWISDGLTSEAKMLAAEALATRGAVKVIESDRATFGLLPSRFEDGAIVLNALRAIGAGERQVTVSAIGPDPNGLEQELARVELEFAAGETAAEARLSLPTELRNRLRRFEISGQRSAGAVTLTDDALKRREVGLLSARTEQEEQELLSPLHYLRRALIPSADIIDTGLEEMLLASPDVVILADVATLSELETAQLTAWVEDGGMLVRFAGPRTAGVEFAPDDPLMPVRLRVGGRSIGGAMSWGEPKALRPFTRESPFFGLPVPDDVEVTS